MIVLNDLLATVWIPWPGIYRRARAWPWGHAGMSVQFVYPVLWAMHAPPAAADPRGNVADRTVLSDWAHLKVQTALCTQTPISC